MIIKKITFHQTRNVW